MIGIHKTSNSWYPIVRQGTTHLIAAARLSMFLRMHEDWPYVKELIADAGHFIVDTSTVANISDAHLLSMDEDDLRMIVVPHDQDEVPHYSQDLQWYSPSICYQKGSEHPFYVVARNTVYGDGPSPDTLGAPKGTRYNIVFHKKGEFPSWKYPVNPADPLNSRSFVIHHGEDPRTLWFGDKKLVDYEHTNVYSMGSLNNKKFYPFAPTHLTYNGEMVPLYMPNVDVIKRSFARICTQGIEVDKPISIIIRGSYDLPAIIGELTDVSRVANYITMFGWPDTEEIRELFDERGFISSRVGLWARFHTVWPMFHRADPKVCELIDWAHDTHSSWVLPTTSTRVWRQWMGTKYGEVDLHVIHSTIVLNDSRMRHLHSSMPLGSVIDERQLGERSPTPVAASSSSSKVKRSTRARQKVKKVVNVGPPRGWEKPSADIGPRPKGKGRSKVSRAQNPSRPKEPVQRTTPRPNQLPPVVPEPCTLQNIQAKLSPTRWGDCSLYESAIEAGNKSVAYTIPQWIQEMYSCMLEGPASYRSFLYDKIPEDKRRCILPFMVNLIPHAREKTPLSDVLRKEPWILGSFPESL